jgi:aspartyl-tRNA(Asn)/glutamyl-tRNA(Gln) amidotransferase subunit B
MEDGSFRCDANISIRPSGSKELLSKVEVKNMNSFKAVYQALKYESKRQRKVLEEGGTLVQETRGWMDEKEVTVSQRSKEYADDYRYFPEPDLPPLFLNRAWIEEIKARLPELPETRKERFMAQYDLPLYDASILTSSRAMADYFEDCLRLTSPNKAKMVSNWLLGDFSRLLNATDSDIENTRISPSLLVELLNLVDKGTISGPTAKAVFEKMFYTGKKASDIVAEGKLSQLSDATELNGIVKQVLANNAKAVADYKAGKQQALTFLTGQIMKATKGTANPAVVREILVQELGGG